jgi:hypothetical protein
MFVIGALSTTKEKGIVSQGVPLSSISKSKVNEPAASKFPEKENLA